MDKEEYNQAMEEMECWLTQEHIKKCQECKKIKKLLTNNKLMKLFRIKKTVTEEYTFEVEAKDQDEAFDKMSRMMNEEAVSHRLIDSYFPSPPYEEIDTDKVDAEDLELTNARENPQAYESK